MSTEPKTLSYNLPQFAASTGVSLSSIKLAIKEGKLTPSYLKTKPLIDYDEGKRFIKSLKAEREQAGE